MRSRAFLDLIVLVLITTLVLVTAATFGVLEAIVEWTQHYASWDLDELLVAMIVLAFLLIPYSYRRWREVRNEISEHEHAEVERERLVSLVENSSDFIGVASLEGQLLFLNEAGQKLVGLTSLAENQAKSMYDFLMEDDLPEFKQRVLPAMMQEGRWQGEFRLKHFKTGAPIPVDMNSFTIRHPQTGEPMALATVSRDVTERQRAEEALRESEERYRSLYTKTPGMLHSIDASGRLVEVSDRWLEVLGYERSEVIGRKSTDFLTAESRQYAETVSLPKFWKTGRVRDVAYQFVKKNGEIVDVLLSAIGERDLEGNVVRTLAVLDDITERKQAEAALRLQSAALESAANAIVITDREGRITWVNPAFTRLTGYTAQEVLGQNPRILKSGEHDEQFYKQIWETILAGQVWSGEIINRRKDGGLYTEEQTITPVCDERGAISHFIAIKQDVTERKRAEEALRVSETKFRTLAETVSVAVFILRGEKMLYVNSAAETLSGYTQEELLEMSIWDAVHPEVQETMRTRAQAKQRGESAPGERVVKIVTKGGEERWAEFRVSTIMFAGEPAVLGAAFDVTERRQAEEALRASEEKYRTIFENVQDIFYQTDGTGIITEISPSVTRFGYSREGIIGTSVLDIYEDPEERTRLVNALIEHGEVADYEIRLKTGDGRVIDTSISARLLRNPDGTFAGSEGTIRDITERKQAERELERALEAERDRSRHDPLTGVLNHAAIVEELRTLVAGDDAGPHAVVMIDVDGLKAMNDSYGHQAGDEALVAVATALTRDGAIVGRYGGDEFVVVLPGADRRAAEIYCDVVSAKLADVRITDADSGTKVPVQASLGLAVYPEDAATVKELIKLSDSAMYAAKRQRAVGPGELSPSRTLGGERAAAMVGQIIPLLTASGTMEDKLRLVAHRLSVGAGYDAVNVDVFAHAAGLPTARNTFSRVPDEVTDAWQSQQRRMEDEPILRHIKSTRRALIVEDPQNDERLTEVQLAVLRAAELQSAVVVPLFWEDDMIGALSVASKRKDAFSAGDIEFLTAIATQITSVVRMATLLDELQSKSDHLAQAREEAVLLLAASAEAHDGTTGHHLRGVRDLAEALALELSYDEESAREVGMAAVLHDIGKNRVPDHILSTPGKLTDEQWQVLIQHTVWGAEFLESHGGFELAATVARSHHERWDGSGYPEGLAGDAILEAATIVTVADAFDAMVSDRPYRASRPFDEAVQEIVACSGSQFNPKVVEALVRLHKRNAPPR
ncbi:MAG: PAS domain S-box protein, partial [Chloroflexi bacterium]|nr:PAS domain S-box protein [Chloroflexota bacterium]